VDFEFGDLDRTSVIGSAKLFPAEVRDGMTLPVGHIDLDELESHRNLVLERLQDDLPARNCGEGNGESRG
jgi:hypothetical protein